MAAHRLRSATSDEGSDGVRGASSQFPSCRSLRRVGASYGVEGKGMPPISSTGIVWVIVRHIATEVTEEVPSR